MVMRVIVPAMVFLVGVRRVVIVVHGDVVSARVYRSSLLVRTYAKSGFSPLAPRGRGLGRNVL